MQRTDTILARPVDKADTKTIFQTLVQGVERGDFRTEPLQPGMRVHHYEVLEPIGSGGTSTVYGARHVYLDHQVALKTVGGSVATGEVGARFIREAQTLAVINHPGVVRVHDAGYHDHVPYVVVEWLRGQTIKRHLATKGQFSVDRVLDLLEQVGDVLRRQEQLGITHRDIKPGNVYIRTSGQYCLFDYGLVGAEGKDEASLESVNTAVTMAGAVMGTPQYMAPEQAREDGTVDHQADLYSLGLVAWECLAGSRARKGESVFELLQASMRPIPPITDARPDVPSEVETMLATLTAVDPADRYESAVAFLDDLHFYRYRGRAPYGSPVGTAFVASPFAQAFDRVFETILRSALEIRLSARRVDKLVYLDNIWQQIVYEIEHAHVVIADFTGGDAGTPNVNVVTEAAHARAIGKPLIVVTQDDPELLPFDWRHVPVLRYEDSESGLERLSMELQAKLHHCLINV